MPKTNPNLSCHPGRSICPVTSKFAVYLQTIFQNFAFKMKISNDLTFSDLCVGPFAIILVVKQLELELRP